MSLNRDFAFSYYSIKKLEESQKKKEKKSDRKQEKKNKKKRDDTCRRCATCYVQQDLGILIHRSIQEEINFEIYLLAAWPALFPTLPDFYNEISFKLTKGSYSDKNGRHRSLLLAYIIVSSVCHYKRTRVCIDTHVTARAHTYMRVQGHSHTRIHTFRNGLFF